jgi:LmbE family N-acetylglucosaminyl deacetylase
VKGSDPDFMKLKLCLIAAFVSLLAAFASAQISTPDARYKADILVVVAHPDDDTLISTYLARAIIDQHKRVAVVYCTRGDSGSNSEGRERARALGAVREIEGRRAMNVLGITNVWFLDGRDVASQNVLVSLAIWPSASVLEQVVRIFRITRPEVVMTWLPSSVAGENHGDHQASGVIATQAFDMSGDPIAFPWQVAAPIRQFENALEGLSPWQAKKLYYFTDAFDSGFMQGHGPEYSGKDISPSRHSSYLQLAAPAAAPYYTQSFDPKVNRQIEAGNGVDAAIKQLQGIGYLSDPVRLWMAKSHVKSSPTADIFEGITSQAIQFSPPPTRGPEDFADLRVELAGPWGFYREFWRAHDLPSMKLLRPEIAIQPNDTLTIPLLVHNGTQQAQTVTASIGLPPGWKQKSDVRPITVPAGGQLTIAVPVIAQSQQSEDFVEIRVAATVNGRELLHESIFAKVNAYVAGQLKY